MLEKKLLIELKEFLASHTKLLKSASIREDLCCDSIFTPELVGYIEEQRKPTFNQLLLTFIDKSGASDPDIYKRAGIDRKHFSKIRSNPAYRPGKNTAIALALALELDRDETDELLTSAGYYLSASDTSDLIIQFCLEKKIYNIQDVNEALDYFSLKPLTGVLE